MGAEKRSTLNVLFIIKKSKLLKNGEAPICMRITDCGNRAIEHSIPISSKYYIRTDPIIPDKNTC